MGNHYPPWSVYEARFALYAVSSTGVASDARWYAGGCLEGLEISEGYDRVRIRRHGEPYGHDRHTDEEHVIEIENLWVMERGTKAMPRFGRSQRFALVVLWVDEEARTWVKRVYRGVQLRDRRIFATPGYSQRVTLSAGWLDRETSGTLDDGEPGLEVTSSGIVRFVDEDGFEEDLYTFAEGAFTGLGGEGDATAEIYEGTEESGVRILGEKVLTVDAAGLLRVCDLTAMGGTVPYGNALPRVEFWWNGVRVACVTGDGELAVADIEETDSLPVDGFLLDVDSDPALRIGTGGVKVAEVEEACPS